MGTSLTYVSQGQISPQDHVEILREAEELQRRRRWWCEPINFFEDPDNALLLNGDTKLFLTGYTTDDDGYRAVDPDHDTLMALRDASVILDQLKHWSGKYGISWQLQIEGENIGTVQAGKLDREAEAFIESMRSMGSPDSSDAAILAIDREHSSRWDDSVGGDLFYVPEISGPTPERGHRWWRFWE